MDIEKAIKNVKEQLKNIKKANECGLATKGEFNEDIEAIESVLNELETAQKETQQVLDDYQDLGKEYYQVCCELELADRVIHLMSKKIYEEGIVWENQEEVKEYFYKKAEEK